MGLWNLLRRRLLYSFLRRELEPNSYPRWLTERTLQSALAFYVAKRAVWEFGSATATALGTVDGSRIWGIDVVVDLNLPPMAYGLREI